ncbi:hypothetical protein [Xanthomonas euvesicatoria]|uniref:hypothetical protein n=1 Tax=Xanthomonas euvesicatoria TaxID=456327 RepID=UPI00145C80D2|nr:hypothetical protein [Xanthomonas euvesicatoria]
MGAFQSPPEKDLVYFFRWSHEELGVSLTAASLIKVITPKEVDPEIKELLNIRRGNAL